jgi:hypothetical protein
MMSRGWLLTIVIPDEASKRSVEHSEGKGGESVMAILRFQCGSPCPYQLWTAPFWYGWQVLSYVLTTCNTPCYEKTNYSH